MGPSHTTDSRGRGSSDVITQATSWLESETIAKHYAESSIDGTKHGSDTRPVAAVEEHPQGDLVLRVVHPAGHRSTDEPERVPDWVCCPHGGQYEELADAWRLLKARGCDECSIIGLFLLGQLNPEGKAAFDEAFVLLQTDADEVVRNPSNWLSKYTEERRRV